MISILTIDNLEYEIAAGPSIDRSFLVALVRNSSRAPICLLDIDLSLLYQLEIDRKHSKIKVSSQPEKAAVNLDFRRIESDIVIEFSSSKALAKVLKQFPTKLTETPDSQMELSQREVILLEPIFIDNSKYSSKEVEYVADGEVEMHVDGDEVDDRDSRNSRPAEVNASYNLSTISTPRRELSSGSAPRSSRISVAKTYSRNKSRRFAHGPDGKKNNKNPSLETRLVAAKSSTSDTENDEDDDRTHHKTQQTQLTAYDSPPPGGDNKSRPRLRAKTTSAPVSRKRNRDDDDEEYQPNGKRPRIIKAPASNSVSFNKKDKLKRSSLPSKLTSKSNSRPNNRRHSAPVKGSQYAPVNDDIGDLEETLSARRPHKRRLQVKSQLAFVNSGPLPLSVPESKIAKENRVNKTVTLQDSSPEMVEKNTKENSALRESHGYGEPLADDEENGDDGLDDEIQVDHHHPSINHAHGNSLPSRTNILAEITLKPPPKNHTPTVGAKDGPPHKSDTVKPISLPGRRDTPTTVTSQKTSKRKEKDLLDTILEVQHDESHLDYRNEFRLKRINYVDEEEETWSQHNSPTPSHFITRARISNDESSELCLPPGYTTTKSPKSPPRGLPLNTTTFVKKLFKSETLQMRTPDLGIKKLAPISERPTSQQVNRISSMSYEQPTQNAAREVPSQQTSFLGSKRGQSVDGFHARLLKKGISFSTSDAMKNQQPEDLDTTDSDMSDDESGSDLDEKMQEDHEYPEHQQHVRDAFCEITEAFPHVTHAKLVYIQQILAYRGDRFELERSY